MSTPHSLAIWLVSEVHERMSDGNLTGMPVGRPKRFSSTLHFNNKAEAESALTSLVENIKRIIEDVKSSTL